MVIAALHADSVDGVFHLAAHERDVGGAGAVGADGRDGAEAEVFTRLVERGEQRVVARRRRESQE